MANKLKHGLRPLPVHYDGSMLYPDTLSWMMNSELLSTDHFTESPKAACIQYLERKVKDAWLLRPCPHQCDQNRKDSSLDV